MLCTIQVIGNIAVIVYFFQKHYFSPNTLKRNISGLKFVFEMVSLKLDRQSRIALSFVVIKVCYPGKIIPLASEVMGGSFAENSKVFKKY